MTDEIKKDLALAGIDVNGGIDRCMGNEGLYERFLKKFLNDGNWEGFIKAMDGKDYKTAESCIHSLKGVCGNLSMDSLYASTSEITGFLRASEYEKAEMLAKKAGAEYKAVCDAIKRWF